MTSVIEYKIYCLTEQQVMSGLTYPPLLPVCPHDPQHLVRPETLTKIKEIKEQTVEIKEDSIQTGDNFQIKGWELNVAGDTGVTGLDIKFDIPISIKSVSYLADPSLVGDYIDSYAIPNFSQEGLVGFLTQDAHSGDTLLHVDRGASSVLYPLYHVIINDGTKKQDLGEIKSVDRVNNTITLSQPISDEFRQGSSVQMMIHRINRYYLHDQQVKPIGDSIIKGATLPPDTVARMVYTNVNRQPKKFRFFAEIRY